MMFCCITDSLWLYITGKRSKIFKVVYMVNHIEGVL